MIASEADRRNGRLAKRLILYGFALRLVLLFLTRGTNDTDTWLWFAESVGEDGLGITYLEQVRFNHPPLMGLMVVGLLWVSDAIGVPFWVLLKLPSVLAEGATTWLLYRIWLERAGATAGLRAAAAYAVALSPIMISGYHGNTDAIYFSFVIAAAYLLESRRAPFWAGLVMAGALNVKLIPLVAVLPLWSRCQGPRAAGRYAVGGVLGALPFFWALVSFGPEVRRAFLARLLLYRSNLDFWGVELFVRWGQRLFDPVAPSLGRLVREAGDLYASHGGELVMLISALIAARHLALTRRDGRAALSAYELVFLGFSVFLVLGPGFGVQYAGCVVAPLIAMNIGRGLLVATLTGLHITAVYAYFVVSWFPVYSFFTLLPPAFTPLALLAWGSVLWATKDLWPRLGGRRAT